MDSTWSVADVVARMDEWYPPHTAESWDRVGLVLGDPTRRVHRLLLAVDPVAATVGEALDHGADMVITHHPLYLRGTSFLPEDDPKGALVARLIRSGTALLNAHTNADIAWGGVSAALADLVGLRDSRPLEPTGEDAGGHAVGFGRIGGVTPQSLGAFADHVASVLPAGPHGLLVGGDEGATVRVVAVSGGAGDHFLHAARRAGADVFLTADLRHHPASEHLEGGAPALLCASHWATEWPWLPVLARRLRGAARADGVELDVEVSTMVTEPWNTHRPTTGGHR
ncbi:Nif3-like dinuclear metal center hexameric protein [Actinomyces provencensis]|uniref:Nif3-like dinuclear metal center hexameric protein n=2 Tax=Actinomyces TaxID=1654 RepID=UPI00096A5C22|nr:Nif3-like dinuclear metal center hexameric protein [Actinomyces provencensis]